MNIKSSSTWNNLINKCLCVVAVVGKSEINREVIMAHPILSLKSYENISVVFLIVSSSTLRRHSDVVFVSI